MRWRCSELRLLFPLCVPTAVCVPPLVQWLLGHRCVHMHTL